MIYRRGCDGGDDNRLTITPTGYRAGEEACCFVRLRPDWPSCRSRRRAALDLSKVGAVGRGRRVIQ
jgi:hypothetical protein